jgi:hypothetical protein
LVGGCDTVGYQDIGSLRLGTNTTIPVTTASTVVVVLTYPPPLSGTLVANGVLRYNASIALDLLLHIEDAQVDGGGAGRDGEWW